MYRVVNCELNNIVIYGSGIYAKSNSVKYVPLEHTMQTVSFHD